MNCDTLGEQIAKFRKAQGLTQEDLAKAVGVSSQAVSRWECGGAPDVALLPAIGDKLGVTIDALFGREAGERVDVAKVVDRWLREFPERERMERFCRLVWKSMGGFLYDGMEMPRMEYLQSSRQHINGENQLMYTMGRSGGGILMDVHAADLAFVTLWPEPEEGYAAYFPPMENCRQLFSILAKPHCLEILDTLGRQKCGFFLPEVLSRKVGIPTGEVAALLDEMEKAGVVCSMELEMEQGEVKAYKVSQPLKLIPLMMAAQSFMETKVVYMYSYDEDIPLLRGAKWKRQEDESHEQR